MMSALCWVAWGLIVIGLGRVAFWVVDRMV